MRKAITFAALSILLGACSQDASAPAKADLPPVAKIYADAVASPTRLEGDYARDANRSPDRVMEFMGIEPGMHILDMFSGGGYYTELIATVVGDEGQVSAHMNQAFRNYAGDEFTLRYENNRLPNVSVLWAENNELELTEGQFDGIMLVLAYHDIYWTPGNDNWPTIDGPKLLAELHKGLKADGFVGIVDHAALPGSGQEAGNSVHRIDEALVIAEMEAAGFVLDGKSDLLRNPDDDRGLSAFDDSVRGKTDRFILRFRKAAPTT